jgi:hypothetical protein
MEIVNTSEQPIGYCSLEGEGDARSLRHVMLEPGRNVLSEGDVEYLKKQPAFVAETKKPNSIFRQPGSGISL